MTMNVAWFAQVRELRGQSADMAVHQLQKGLFEMGVDCSPEQKSAWRGSWQHLQRVFVQLPDDLWVGFEYRLPMSSQRIDVIFLGENPAGKPTVGVLELKGWRQVTPLSRGLVQADGSLHQSPDIQAEDYVGKLCYTHSEAHRFDFFSVVWIYNAPPGTLKTTNEAPPFFFKGEDNKLAGYLKQRITKGISADLALAFIAGQYTQTIQLFQAIQDNFDLLRQGAIDALSTQGFAPTEQQRIILEHVSQTVCKGEPTTFLIQGGPGSGKSYLAIMLLLKALAEAGKMGQKRQNVAALGYRNNRLLNTVRKIFQRAQPGLDSAIKYFSTKRFGSKGFGLADDNPALPTFQLTIFDEAQRIAPQQVEQAMQRGIVTVFLFDESQRLNVDEGGTEEAFEEAAAKSGREIIKYTLQGVYRVEGGELYHKFVESLIACPTSGGIPRFPNYEFRVFTDITKMLQHLREKGRAGYHVAIVASFTESPGDRRNPQEPTLENRRVGYPLYSGFNHYRGQDVDIYWLMDPKTQYPAFWYDKKSNDLTHCASIYGCQGFEADYVGVIWGRDFVWDPQEQRWTLGPNCEDTIGRPSLKELFQRKDEVQALPLLRNRYRIFLTRGIKGTYIYCEDENTARYLRQIYQHQIARDPLDNQP